jgi:hypothetical protein
MVSESGDQSEPMNNRSVDPAVVGCTGKAYLGVDVFAETVNGMANGLSCSLQGQRAEIEA